MRMLGAVLLFSSGISMGLGQGASSESSTPCAEVSIHRLTIEANSLPNEYKERITHLFEEHSFPRGEVETRVEIALHDLGYFYAHVDEPRFSFLGHGTKDADVSERVELGAQYRLGKIRFGGARLFSSDRLRSLIPIQAGDLFAATAIGRGLESLHKLYGSQGYVDFVPVAEPIIDESSRIVDLVIEIDEGRPYDFGQLVLNGIEPRPGAGKALLASWKTLQGKRYNPALLERWLAANTSDWPRAASSISIAPAVDPESQVVNVKLLLPYELLLP